MSCAVLVLGGHGAVLAQELKDAEGFVPIWSSKYDYIRLNVYYAVGAPRPMWLMDLRSVLVQFDAM